MGTDLPDLITHLREMQPEFGRALAIFLDYPTPETWHDLSEQVLRARLLLDIARERIEDAEEVACQSR